MVLRHNIINNTVTSPKSDNWTPLNSDQLKTEIERLQRKVAIIGIVYCVREGAVSELKGKVISKPGYNLHPNAKDKYKIVQNRLRYVENNTKMVLRHNIINNTVTSPKSDNWTPLNSDQLKTEIERLQRKVAIIGIVYCVREGAPDVYNK